MQLVPTFRKIPPIACPFGNSICTRSEHVWAAYKVTA